MNWRTTPILEPVRRHWRAYLIINIGYYGLVLLGTAYAFMRPQAQIELIGAIVDGFSAPPLSIARDAYLSGDVASAALVTFLVNSLLGAFAAITLPSLVIPFAGTFVGFYRALLWGVALAPTTPELARAMVPHSLTLVLEGQGYILAMLGVHVLWVSALPGLRSGISGFLSGYLAGLRRNLPIFTLVALVLAVAAIYEALELIYIVGVEPSGAGG